MSLDITAITLVRTHIEKTAALYSDDEANQNIIAEY